jgi:hypothetical protein
MKTINKFGNILVVTIQLSIQGVPEALTPGVKRRGGVKLTIHLHLVPRLRMHKSTPPLPHTSSRRGA